jgi:hypothetical protein
MYNMSLCGIATMNLPSPVQWIYPNLKKKEIFYGLRSVADIYGIQTEIY